MTPSAEPTRPGAPTRNPGASARRRNAAYVLTFALAGALLSLALGPDPRLGEERSGDPRLIRDVEAIVEEGRGIPALSVARIENAQVAFAGAGDVDGSAPSPDTLFELGSITKTFTGHLLADAVERGEMRLRDRLETHLPELAGTPAGGVTLAQLATHTSGLPRLAPGSGSPIAAFTGADPYHPWTAEQVVDAARTVELEDVGRPAYSNFGMALLGHAQARAARAGSWQDLATERILRPLEMTSTTFVAAPGAEPTGLARPHWSNGREVDPWTGDGWAPAGSSTRTSARDLARYAQAVLAGTVPGAAALRPVDDISPDEGRRAGLAWVIQDAPDNPGRTVTWHNGGTGGSSTMIALDVAGGRGAIALANSERPVDDLAVGLISDRAHPLSSTPNPMRFIALGVGLLALVSLLRRLTRQSTRLALATGVVDAGSCLVLAGLFGPWDVVPGWVLGALAGAVAGGGVLAVLVGRHAPTAPPTGRTGALVSLVVSLAFAGLVVLVVA